MKKQDSKLSVESTLCTSTSWTHRLHQLPEVRVQPGEHGLLDGLWELQEDTGAEAGGGSQENLPAVCGGRRSQRGTHTTLENIRTPNIKQPTNELPPLHRLTCRSTWMRWPERKPGRTWKTPARVVSTRPRRSSTPWWRKTPTDAFLVLSWCTSSVEASIRRTSRRKTVTGRRAVG